MTENEYYVYRFLNENNETIYVGKAKNIDSRIKSHNHLPKECYSEVKRIEYIKCLNENESAIYEIYLINIYSPKYNIQHKKDSKFSFKLPCKLWNVLDCNDFEYIKNEIIKKSFYISTNRLKYFIDRTYCLKVINYNSEDNPQFKSWKEMVSQPIELKYIPVIYDVKNKCHRLYYDGTCGFIRPYDEDYKFYRRIKIDEDLLKREIDYRKIYESSIKNELFKDINKPKTKLKESE